MRWKWAYYGHVHLGSKAHLLQSHNYFSFLLYLFILIIFFGVYNWKSIGETEFPQSKKITLTFKNGHMSQKLPFSEHKKIELSLLFGCSHSSFESLFPFPSQILPFSILPSLIIHPSLPPRQQPYLQYISFLHSIQSYFYIIFKYN